MTQAHLSQDALQLLEDAGCAEVTNEHIVIGDGLHVRIPLSRRTIAELNRQAFTRWVDLGQPSPDGRRRVGRPPGVRAADAATHSADGTGVPAAAAFAPSATARASALANPHVSAEYTDPHSGSVTLPRATLDALESERRHAAALRRLFDFGPVMPLAFESRAPYRLRDVPLALSHATGHCLDPGLRGQPLEQLFDADSSQRIHQVLRDAPNQVVTLSVTLRCTNGRELRCSMHVAPRDALEPELRWASLVETSPEHQTAAAQCQPFMDMSPIRSFDAALLRS